MLDSLPPRVLVLGWLALATCRTEVPEAQRPTAEEVAPRAAVTVVPSSPVRASPCPDGATVAASQITDGSGVIVPDPELVARACLHCSMPAMPDDLPAVLVAFPARDARWPGPAEPSETEARLVAAIKQRPDLALRVRGDHGPRESRALARRRAEATRQHLLSLGLRDGQVLIADLDPNNHALPQVIIDLWRSVPEPVALGEPCGTDVVAAVDDAGRVAAMATRGWQFRADGAYQPGQRATSGALLRGSRLAVQDTVADGFVELRRGAHARNAWFLSFDRDGALRGEQPLRSPPSLAAPMALATTPEGTLVVWSEGLGQLCTTVFDGAGERQRPEHCERFADHGIYDLAVDFADGAGAIVFSANGPTMFYGHVEFVPIDAQGLRRGDTRTLVMATEAMFSVAVAVLGSERISVLASGCEQFVARLDVDARGEVMAADRRFLRRSGRLGVATVQGPSGAWGVSIDDSSVDIRPLCPLPATSGRR